MGASDTKNSLLRKLVGDRGGPWEEEMRDDGSELSELESSVVGAMEVEEETGGTVFRHPAPGARQ